MVIGDSYAQQGTAEGGKSDKVEGGKAGNDIVIGDNAATDQASGAGGDDVNGLKGNDLLVGDNMPSPAART